ncbi:MAG: hypothetical protein ACRDSF_14710 [Pseudonocardiaceae bacterium]
MTTTTTTAETGAERHWLTRYDPDDGEPYGEFCECPIGANHDGSGNLSELDDRSGAITETPPATADTGAIDPPTLTEFIAGQLCSTHVVDGRVVQMSATADGATLVIDIEHPFPPESRIRILADLQVLVPDDALPDAEIADAQTPDGAEVSA